MQNTIKTENYKFILVQKEKKVQLTAVDNNTLEMFQSEQIELQNISPVTISAALKQENKHIKYQLQRNETSIVIIIDVNFDFLPKITEQIQLILVQKQESYLNIQLKEINEQLRNLEQQYKEKNTTKFTIHEVQNLSAEYDITQGAHLIQFSGLMVRGYQSQDYNGNYLQRSTNLVCQAYQGKDKKQMKLISKKSFPIIQSMYEEYEYPFKITFTTKLQKKGKLILKFNPYNPQITAGLLTIITQ